MEDQITQNEEVSVPKKVNFLSIFLFVLILGFGVLLLGINSDWKFKDFDWNNICITKEDSADTEVTAQSSRFVSKYGFSIDVPNYSDYEISGYSDEEIEMYEEKASIDKGTLRNTWSLLHNNYDWDEKSSADYGKFLDGLVLSYSLRDVEIIPDSMSEVRDIGGAGLVINVYLNEKELVLNDYVDLFTKNTNEDSAPVGLQDGTFGEKWGQKIWTAMLPDITGEGSQQYLFVKDDYLYHLSYGKTALSEESEKLVDQVVDSIKFE